jgi:heat shock protein HslJ
MKIFSILIIVMLSIKSCGDTSVSNNYNSEELTGEFHIISIHKIANLPDNLTISLDRSVGKVSGYSGCNRYFGSFILEGKSLTFDQMGSTRKMCFGDANKIENEFLKLLPKIKTFTFENNTLNFISNGDILIKAKK